MLEWREVLDNLEGDWYRWHVEEM